MLDGCSLRYYKDTRIEDVDSPDGRIDLSVCSEVSEVPTSRNYGFKIKVLYMYLPCVIITWVYHHLSLCRIFPSNALFSMCFLSCRPRYLAICVADCEGLRVVV